METPSLLNLSEYFHIRILFHIRTQQIYENLAHYVSNIILVSTRIHYEWKRSINS